MKKKLFSVSLYLQQCEAINLLDNTVQFAYCKNLKCYHLVNIMNFHPKSLIGSYYYSVTVIRYSNIVIHILRMNEIRSYHFVVSFEV